MQGLGREDPKGEMKWRNWHQTVCPNGPLWRFAVCSTTCQSCRPLPRTATAPCYPGETHGHTRPSREPLGNRARRWRGNAAINANELLARLEHAEAVCGPVGWTDLLDANARPLRLSRASGRSSSWLTTAEPSRKHSCATTPKSKKWKCVG